MTTLSLILAMTDAGVIGKAGAIPWRLPEDMRRFKALTLTKPNIMGRKTWESLPKKPLPGRQNIVVTRDRGFRAEGARVVSSLEQALKVADETQTPEIPAPEIMVIGGAEIYRAALPLAHRIHLTQIHADIAGDTIFVFDPAPWRETAREDHVSEAGLAYSYITLDRA